MALAFTAVVVFVIYRFFPWQAFRFDQLDPRLPEAFHYNDSPWIFWGWVVVLLSLAALAVIRLRAALGRGRAALGSARLSEPQAGAWESDGTQTGEIVFPPGTEPTDPIYLFLSTSDAPVTELFRATGVVSGGNVMLTTQPQRALLINAASASMLSRGEDAPGSAPGLESLGLNLLARDPEYPWLRGVYVVLPCDELERADPSTWARRLHADLHTIRRVMQLEVPTYLVVSGMEKVPGFIEFAKLRGTHEQRQGRWGISLPRCGDDAGDSAWRSMVEFRFRVRRWTIDLLARDLLNSDRNARLQGLDRTLGTLWARLATLTAGAFPAAENERPYLRAIDLVATGSKPEEQAYLLSSIFLPVFQDEAATRWTSGALADDRAYRRRAAAIATGAGALAACVWLYIQLVLGSLGILGWIILGGLSLGWVAALVVMWRRWPSSPVERAS